MHISSKIFLIYTILCSFLWLGSNSFANQFSKRSHKEDSIKRNRPKSPISTPKVNSLKLGLSLKEAISLALARNFDISIEKLRKQIKKEEIVEKKSEFDTTFIASGESEKLKNETVSTTATGNTKKISSSQNIQAGFKKKAISGAQLSMLLDWDRERINSKNNLFNPNFSTGLTLSVTQPLLRNYGVDLNSADIRIATENLRQSTNEYKNKITKIVTDVEISYWDLILALRNLKLKKKSLELAKDLLRRNKIQVKIGTLTRIEILDAKTSVAMREDELIVAKRDSLEKEDALKILLNVPMSSESSRKITLNPTNKLSFKAVKLNEFDLFEKALSKRTDLMKDKIEIRKKRITIDKKWNLLLPKLDLTSSLKNSSRQDSTTKALKRQFSNKGYEISGKLAFEFPLGNREAKSNYRKSRNEYYEAKEIFKKNKQKILEEVQKNSRMTKTSMKRIKTTRLAKKLAKQRLKVQEQKFSLGLATSRQILEDQESLESASLNHIHALINYKKNLALLRKTTQTTLTHYKITLSKN
ncbi:MAG: TolC family protein [Nitrospinota bacterium]|nr:TolC family protein [Nitrospinota bacterium]